MAIYAVHSPAHERDPVAAFERARTSEAGLRGLGLRVRAVLAAGEGLWLALAGWVLRRGASGSDGRHWRARAGRGDARSIGSRLCFSASRGGRCKRPP